MQRVADCIQAALRHQAAHVADAERVAAMAVAIWGNVDRALSPIIGKGGVTALFRRSVFLTLRAYPRLASVTAGDSRLDGVARLQTALSAQTGIVAATANCALLQAFCDLLSGLIGSALAEHLLQSAWDLLQSAWDTPSGGLTDPEHPP